MYLVTVLFWILIQTNSAVGKGILFDRRNMDSAKQISSEENDSTVQINTSAVTKYETENSKSLMNSITQDNSATARVIDQTDLKESKESVRRLHPSDQLHRHKVPSSDTVEKEAMKYFATHRNIDLTDFPESKESVRRLHPSDQLHQHKVPGSDTVEKEALRQSFSVMNFDGTTQCTTSEDTLQWLLLKQVPFRDPAPYQVGQREKGLMYPVTEPLWRFEGYDDSKSVDIRYVRNEYKDCEGQKIQCIDDTDYNQPVCVTDRTLPLFLDIHARMKGFGSFCEVEYRNCLKRYELTGKDYADSYAEDYLEFLHYGWCIQCDSDQRCNA